MGKLASVNFFFILQVMLQAADPRHSPLSYQLFTTKCISLPQHLVPSLLNNVKESTTFKPKKQFSCEKIAAVMLLVEAKCFCLILTFSAHSLEERISYMC